MPPPVTAAPSTGAPGSGARRPRGGPARSDPTATWRGWWAVNDRALMPERADVFAVTTPTDDGETFETTHRRRREQAVRDEILPALRTVLAPEAKVSDLLRRTSLLALGKVAQSEADTALLLHWLAAKDAQTPVRDAAALGCGLLRRTDPTQQLGPRVLDAIRARLGRVVEDASTPDQVRATSAIAIGLLGDQPFGDGIHGAGRLVTQRLWRSLGEKYARTDLPVALLTALGMQPGAGVPDGVRDALTDAIWGRPVLGRRWNDVLRSHAVTALARLGGGPALTTPLKVLQARRMPTEVRRAAFLALGRTARDLTVAERVEAAGVLRAALRSLRDPLTRGLADIAIGHLVAAQLADGAPLAPDLRTLWRKLVADARSGSSTTRGFAALGIGLAARADRADDTRLLWLRTTRDEAEKVLLQGLQAHGSDADLRGAHAVALGIMGAPNAGPVLAACVEDRSENDRLRADAAVSLGLVGQRRPDIIRALHLALAEGKRPRVRTGAALGLSLLQGPSAGHRLLRDLERATSTEDVIRLTEPLGYLGDPVLATPLVSYAASTRNANFPRALMFVALGNIGDPEPRPSLTAVAEDANYPTAPPTLRDVLFTR